MIMKKLLIILFVFALFFTLVSCNESEKQVAEQTKENDSPSITTTESETKDRSPSPDTSKNDNGDQAPSETTTVKQTEKELTFPSSGNGEIDLPSVGID